MIARLAVALVVVAGVAHAEPRTAQLVDEANTAFAELRYDDALGLLERAWHRGESQPAQLRALFALAGQAAAAMGQADDARLWFSRWLCLEPDAQLPPGTSPKLTALLAEARRGLGGGKLAVRLTAKRELVLAGDPLAMVVAVRAGAQRARLEADTPIAILDEEATIELLDRDGNVLLATPFAALAAPPVAVTVEAAPPWYARWPAWAIAAGAFGAAGAASLFLAVDARSGLRALNQDSGAHEFSEAQALERRFDRAQWGARILFGGALIAASIGVVVHVRGRAVRAAPTPTGAAVGWSF